MPLTIPDDVLRKTGMSEDEARVEIACRLFEAGKLALWPAAQWAGLSRSQFEEEVLDRRIPLYRPTQRDLDAELDAMDKLGI
jgi:predicted HTH domain antitoxin